MSRNRMTADPATYVFERQVLWAYRHGKRLRGSAGHRGRPAYTETLDDNLFESLTAEAREEYAKGDGRELGRGGSEPGKMQAVHSSSALSCNLFHYWRRINRLDIIATACGLPQRNLQGLAFEQHFTIDARFRFAPNLDAVFTYGGTGRRQIGVECKFSEPFSTRTLLGLKEEYLRSTLDDVWKTLPSLRTLARELSPDNRRYKYLDAAQLVKHVLGLRRSSGSACQLLYLYYDAPGVAGATHSKEVQDFVEIAREDQMNVISATYQDTLIRLAREQRAQHAAYMDYMVERYL